jgi:hypothetical protein
VQAVAEVHDTALSEAETAPDGVGVFRIVHTEPSHASANGAGASLIVLVAFPTAVQAVADAHEIGPSEGPFAFVDGP